MTNKTLNRAYKIIFETEPELDAEDWQIAEKLMRNFDMQKLGEDLAKEVVYAVVLDIKIPNQEKTTEIVGMAEGFAGELWDDLPDEVHMADLERKRFSERQEKDGELAKIH